MSKKARFIEVLTVSGEEIANTMFDDVPLALRQIWASAAK
jgi:hypothetical protein